MTNQHYGCGWAPNHITGFFYPIIDNDPLRSSSLGAGINLSKGTTSAVHITPGNHTIDVKINGKQSEAEISRWIIRTFLDSYAHEEYRLDVSHTIEMPLSAGFGTSGSGALSLSLALKEAMESNISTEECYTLAHIADAENKGGLGTVMAEIAGGLEVRLAFGGPGVGKVESIPIDQNLQVIILYFGPYTTREALADKSLIEKVHTYGMTCVNDLLKKPSIENFLELSQWFVSKIEVAPKNVKNIIKKMSNKGYVCSMPLFGESVFSIQSKNDAEELSELFKEYSTVIVSAISNKGPHIC